MQTDTSLALSYVEPDNKTTQKSITYANPAAENADLVTFSQKLVGLTNNTFDGLIRIDKVKIG